MYALVQGNRFVLGYQTVGQEVRSPLLLILFHLKPKSLIRIDIIFLQNFPFMKTAIASPPGTHWQWQGHDIYYVHASEPQLSDQTSKPSLLLIHGFGASTDHWRKNMVELQHDFDVWAIDLLGFGRSAKPDITYSAEVWQHQLQDFILEMIGCPAVLAGNSLGGYASLCVAAGAPDWVKGVMLLNSAGPFSDAEDKSDPNQSSSFTRQMIKGLRNLIKNIILHPVPSYFVFQYTRRRSTIRKTLEKVYLDPSAVTDQLVEEIYRPSCDPGAAKVFASVFKAKRGEPVNALLQKLNCPLLMIWGEGDPWMNTREWGAKFREYYPTLTEHYVQAGHCPHDEIPQQMNKLMADWIVKIVRTPSNGATIEVSA